MRTVAWPAHGYAELSTCEWCAGLAVPAKGVVRSPRHRAHRVSGGLEKLAMYMNRRKRARVSESPWMAVAAGVEEEDADSGALVLDRW